MLASFPQFCNLAAHRITQLSEFYAAMAIGVRSQKAQCGIEVKDRAAYLTLGKLVIGNRSAQQAQEEFPIRPAARLLHRFFNCFVSFKEISGVEEFHSSQQMLQGALLFHDR